MEGAGEEGRGWWWRRLRRLRGAGAVASGGGWGGFSILTSSSSCPRSRLSSSSSPRRSSSSTSESESENDAWFSSSRNVSVSSLISARCRRSSFCTACLRDWVLMAEESCSSRRRSVRAYSRFYLGGKGDFS